jgi:hypothetical protein
MDKDNENQEQEQVAKPGAEATQTDQAKDQDRFKASMMKSLGFYMDSDAQEKLPDEKKEAETTEEDGDETKPEDAEPEAEGDGEDKGEKPEGDGDKAPEAEKTPAESEVEKTRAKKVPAKPGDVLAERTPASVDDIKSAVREVMAEDKADKPAEDKKPEREGFHPSELRALELAEFAAAKMKDRYADMPAKEMAWIKANRQFIEDYVKEHGKFNARDQSYLDFVVENRPSYGPGDKEELFLIQAEERATKRVHQEIKPQIEERDRQIAELRHTPVIERTVNAVEEDIINSLGDDFKKLYREAPAKVADEFPVEAPIVGAAIVTAISGVKQYLRLVRGIEQYDPSNRAHTEVVDFITNQGRVLDDRVAKNDPIVRDGKIMVSREVFGKMIAAKKDTSKYATFTDPDIINMVAHATKAKIASEIKSEAARHQKIAEKQTKTAAAKKAEAPPAEKKAEERTNPPKGGAAKSPGSKGAPSPAKSTPAYIRALGLEGAQPEKN